MTTAYPLAWPAGWPRTSAAASIDGRGRFLRGGAYGNRAWTFAEARDALYAELDKMGVPNWNIILSTNFMLTHRGEPSAGKGRPADQGVAIYFRRDGRQLVMACDRYLRAEENLRSLALAIEAMRQLERHGGGVMMDKAFAGFAALDAPGNKPWHLVLEVSAVASPAEIDAAYKRLAQTRHPDRGGSDAMMADLNAARDQARRSAS